MAALANPSMQEIHSVPSISLVPAASIRFQALEQHPGDVLDSQLLIVGPLKISANTLCLPVTHISTDFTFELGLASLMSLREEVRFC